MKLIEIDLKNISFPIVTSILFFLFTLLSGINIYIGPFFCYTFSITIPLFFSIIPEFITRARLKKTNKSSIISQEDCIIHKDSIFIRVEKKTKKLHKIIFWIILIGLNRFISDICLRFFRNLQLQCYTMLMTFLGIVITWCIQFLFFKTKLGRHHIISLCCLALICIIEIICFYDDFMKYVLANFMQRTYMFIIMAFLYTSSLSIKEVVERMVMLDYFISPYFLLFYEGIISSIFILLLFGTMQWIPCPAFGIFEFLCKQSIWPQFKINFLLLYNCATIHTLYIWLFIIVGILLYCFRIHMNKQLTPTHRYISENIANLDFLIFQLIRNLMKEPVVKPLSHLMIAMSLEILAIFCYSVYNEHIIIHFWGISYDTKKEIEQRGLEETDMEYRLSALEKESEYEITQNINN